MKGVLSSTWPRLIQQLGEGKFDLVHLKFMKQLLITCNIFRKQSWCKKTVYECMTGLVDIGLHVNPHTKILEDNPTPHDIYSK